MNSDSVQGYVTKLLGIVKQTDEDLWRHHLRKVKILTQIKIFNSI